MVTAWTGIKNGRLDVLPQVIRAHLNLSEDKHLDDARPTLFMRPPNLLVKITMAAANRLVY